MLEDVVGLVPVDQLVAAGRWLALGGVAAVGLTAAWWVWWRRRAAGELYDRVVYGHVPSVDFDPTWEEVERWGARVGRASSAAGAVPRRAMAVRVRMSSEQGRLRYEVLGHPRAAGVLGMAPYSKVQVVGDRETTEVPPIRFQGAAPVSAEEVEA